MITPSEIFEDAIETLRKQYSGHRFKLERNVVEAVRLQIVSVVEDSGLPYQVHKEFEIEVSPSEKRRADLAIVNGSSVELVAEFKYEPSHKRHQEFSEGKFPVVDWSGETSVLEDIRRVNSYVPTYAKTAYLVFIDEGSHFSWREAPSGSEWKQWENGVSILWCAIKE